MKGKCPDCDTEFEIDNDYKIGDIASCPCCGLELEIKSIVDGTVKLQELVIEVLEFCGAVVRPCNGPGHGTELTFEEAVEAVRTGSEYESWTLTEEESNAVEQYVEGGAKTEN